MLSRKPTDGGQGWIPTEDKGLGVRGCRIPRRASVAAGRRGEHGFLFCLFNPGTVQETRTDGLARD